MKKITFFLIIVSAGILFLPKFVFAQIGGFGCCCTGEGSSLSCEVTNLVVPTMSVDADVDTLVCPGSFETPVYYSKYADIAEVREKCEAYQNSLKTDLYCLCSPGASGIESVCQLTETSPACSEGSFDSLKEQGYQCRLVGSYDNCMALKAAEEGGTVQGKSLAGAFIPSCATEDVLTERCRDISIFIELAINIGKYVFSFVGALVLLVFIIGGFQLIISQGNPEKIKKAIDIILGAVIGLAIVFGAYMLVNFLASMVGLDEEYQITEQSSK